MKKMMIVVVGMMVVFVMAGMGYADTKILKSSLSCGSEVCKVYTLGRGTLTINCAEKTTTGALTNVSDYTCPTVGNQQVCSNNLSGQVINLKPYETDFVKCQKVCGPSSGVYSFAK